MCAAKGHVCFASESGHVQCTRPCLLWVQADINGAGDDTLSDDPKPIGYDSLVEATGRSLLHLESVDGLLGVV